MSKRIGFQAALALWQAGITGDAAESFRFYVTKDRPANQPLREIWRDGVTYREVPDSRGPGEFWDGKPTTTLGKTASLKSGLSDRFYDSWNDALAPAYDVLEIAQLLPAERRARVTVDDDPEALAAEILAAWNAQRP